MNAFVRKRTKNYIVYLEYKDELGNRKQKNMGAYLKRRDANRRLAELKDKIYNDNVLVPNEITLEEFLLDFLEKHRENISLSTYDKYLRISKKYILKELGQYRLQDLKVIHIQNYIDSLVKTLNPQSIRIHLNILRLVIKRAYKLKLIKENIVEDIDIPRAKKFRNDIYDKEQMINLLEICKEGNKELGLAINLAIGLGFRLSEILGISWDNVNFDENTILINKITSRVKGAVILKEPKTESSNRNVFVPVEIMALLKQYKKEQMKRLLKSNTKNKHNLIFFDKLGDPIAEDVISKKFRRFLKNNGLPHIRFHDLRHSHVTLLMNSKVPIKVISERVGHSNVNTTLNVYSHVLKEMDKEASDTISTNLFKAN
ncbi:tyrosine-type recombinase/integrase [Clostridioides difficile]|uniref:tyrosine-type recombinase/integrase n=1 Tax=Clostridioides difficile TaxID=1496 RepID=UPI0010343BC7|nr:tyrosine-type recombinase/integrase [Clostridioides difficile]MDM9944125.1 tyrosine-type recombinase/integrase [Clostridioides difficile]